VKGHVTYFYNFATPYILATVEARNFKFPMQIVKKGVARGSRHVT